MPNSPDTRVLNIEKRLVDVELSVAEMTNKLKTLDFSGVNEVKQKQEDLEDLILVDNAAVLELKKTLESNNQTSQVTEELKTKVEGLSTEIETLKQAKPDPAQAPDELKAKIDALAGDIQMLKDTKPESTTGIKEYVDSKILQLPSETGADMKNDLMFIKSRLAALENVAAEPKNVSQPVIDELASVRENIRKYVDGKLSEMVAMNSEDVDIKNDLMIVKSRLAALEKNSTESKNLPKSVAAELESIREDLLAVKSRVASTEKLSQDVSMRIEDIEPSIAKIETASSLGSALLEAENKMKEMGSIAAKMDEMKTHIDEKFARISSVYPLVQENSKKTLMLESEIQKMKAQNAEIIKASQLKDAMMQVNGRFEEMQRRLEGNRLFLMESFKQDMMKKMPKIDQGQIYQTVNKIIESRLGKFEAAYNEKVKDSIMSLEEEIRGPDLLNEQMIELVNRTLYLETRLSSLEKTMKEFQQVEMPIIIE